MTKQKPRKFKGWENVPEGVLVTAKSARDKVRDRALIKIDDLPRLMYLDTEGEGQNDVFEFMWTGYNPDAFTTEKYREVIL